MDLSKHNEAAGFIEKIFALCCVTSFDEVGPCQAVTHWPHLVSIAPKSAACRKLPEFNLADFLTGMGVSIEALWQRAGKNMNYFRLSGAVFGQYLSSVSMMRGLAAGVEDQNFVLWGPVSFSGTYCAGGALDACGHAGGVHGCRQHGAPEPGVAV